MKKEYTLRVDLGRCREEEDAREIGHHARGSIHRAGQPSITSHLWPSVWLRVLKEYYTQRKNSSQRGRL